MKTKKISKKIVAITITLICVFVVALFSLLLTKMYCSIQYEKALTVKVKSENEVLQLQKKVFELEYRKTFYELNQ